MSRAVMCLCCVILAATWVANASARPIVYDGFDYAAGTLAGNQGGTGWDAGVAWDGSQVVTSPGLEYPGLPSVGNMVATASTASYRLMPAGFSAANKTIWISFLCQDSATPSWSGISPFTGSSEALFIGKPDTSATWGIALYNAQSDTGAATGAKTSDVAVSERVFFVVRIINGTSDARITGWINPPVDQEPTVDMAFYDNETAGETVGRVLFDRIRIAGADALFYDELRLGETYADVSAAYGAESAASPSPEHEQDDVPLDSILSWTAGQYAATHDVYLGTSYDDVNDASRSNPMGLLVSEGQAETTYDAGILAFGQTYYWRVDEVNAAPDNTIHTGKVWQFTVEPFAYSVEDIVATTNAVTDDGSDIANIVNGSGLNSAGQHSIAAGDMWLGTAGADPIQIDFAFPQTYKLNEMLVWNYNVQFELMLGFGVKDVTIEYSANAVDWIVLGDFELAQATATASYAANTAIDFGGVAVKYVRLTVNSGWGPLGQFGLSEVDFTYVPAHPREPQPADGATDVSVDTLLTWRSGREAVSHDVYIGLDPDGLVLADTVDTAGFTPEPLDMETTYYWQVNEVNEADEVPVWSGATWSFATEPFLVVDDFESYTDDEGSRIYEIWEDGWVNGTGSTVGYLDAPFAEQEIVHGGGQALPLFYDNGSGTTSETDLALSQNWATSNVKSLSLYFYGDPDNSGQLYVKINNVRVDYDGDTADIARSVWQAWNIDLATVGGNLSNVTTLTIGVEGSGATGTLCIDDIRLYAKTPEYITPIEPENTDLVAHYTFDEGSGTTVADASGMGNDGVIEGDPQWVTGVYGGALSFSGNDAVDCGNDASLEIQDAITLACWVKTAGFSNTWETILSRGDDSYRMSRSSGSADDGTGNSVHFGCNGPTGDHLNGNAAITTDTWHHIALVYDGVNKYIYIDGVEDARTATTGQIAVSAYNLYIGANAQQAGRYFHGQLDDVRIYSRALSPEEVAGLAGRVQPVQKPF